MLHAIMSFVKKAVCHCQVIFMQGQAAAVSDLLHLVMCRLVHVAVM
jgi:hypothetical protein